MRAPAFAPLPELEADTGAVRDLSVRWSAGGKWDIVWKWVTLSSSIWLLTFVLPVPSASTTLNQSPTTLDMSHPFHC